MHDETLRLLIIEGVQEDFAHVSDLLKPHKNEVKMERAQSLETAKSLLSVSDYDLILLSFEIIPPDNETEIIQLLMGLAGDIPLILLCAEADENSRSEYLSRGVSDCLFKNELSSRVLLKTIEYNIERKKIQLKLEHSEKKYKSLFDYNPMPMWVLDKDDLSFLSVNQAAIDLYGYTSEEFKKMTVKALWAPSEENRVEKVVMANAEGYFKVRVKHLTKSGKEIVVEVKSNPLIYDGHKARVSLVNDITAQIEAERKIQESEKRFKSLVQEGSDIIAILDCELQYKYCSPSCTSVFGRVPEELEGFSFFDLVHEDDLEKLQVEMADLSEKKRSQLSSYRVKGQNGNYRWLETVATDLKTDEAIRGIVLNSRDITQFVEQEQKLKHSLERYNIVAKATSDLITDYDVVNDYMHVSPAVSEMFGYPYEEVDRRVSWWNEKIHPEEYEQIKSRICEMTKNGVKNLTTEYRFRCADGSYKFILDRSYLLMDHEQNPVRIISSMQDITDRKRHMMEVESHNKRLREIAWTQSHVVRAPLAKLMGLVDLMKNYQNDFDNFDEIMENVLNSANELDQIIRKIATETEKEL